MAQIEFADEVGEDIERILAHLEKYDVADPHLRIEEIIQAISVLEHNPLIGRVVHNDKRELVIGRRSHGYLALYRYITEIDVVFILAIRNQKEAGYVSQDNL
jgi:toxin ParE1/3/4